MSILSPTASFVGAQGLVEVPIADTAAWRATTTRETEDLGALLRFYLDFPQGAERNDVELPAGRVFFTGGAFWDADGLKSAEAKLASLEADYERQYEESTARAKAVDNASPLGRIRAVRAAVLAQDEVVNLRRRIADQQAGLPGDSSVVTGLGGVKLAAEGVLSVKRRGGAFGLREVYNLVGRYEVVQSLDDDAGHAA